MTTRRRLGLSTGICPGCSSRLVVVTRKTGDVVVRCHNPCGAGRKPRSVEPIPANLGRKTD